MKRGETRIARIGTKPKKQRLNDKALKVIEMTALGMTRKEIALVTRMGLTGVDWYLGMARAVLGFSDAARLTHWALKRGLVKLGQGMRGL
jgi:DNA-binding CsgD family transcriptional regulator